MRRGFTLIELLVVISIIALLSSVVLSSLNTARAKAALGAGKQFEANVYHVAAEQAMGIWDLNECSGTTVGDRSGYGYNGAFVNLPTWQTDTPFSAGCSLLFSGSNQGVSAGTIDLSGLSDFTMSAWIKANAFQTVSPFISSIIGEETGAARGMIRLGDTALPNNKVQFTMTGGNINGNTGLSTGVWYQITVSRNGTTGSIYINGNLDSTGTVGLSALPNTTFGIGYNPAFGRYFSGLIDSVRVYSKTLTASEVGKLYAEGLPAHSLAQK